MKKFLFIAILVITALVFIFKAVKNQKEDSQNNITEEQISYSQGLVKDNAPSSGHSLDLPLENAVERITKKPFGIFITPENSPIKLERFSGYHTGTDFEVFDNEVDVSDVSVFSICKGKIEEIINVSGYGGVIVQSCFISNTQVSVIYGHISIDKTIISKGDEIEKGQKITVLGKNNSNETDGERKHLHLGIIRGGKVDFRGYVDEEELLSRWIDFEEIADSL